MANENKYHPIRDYLSALVWDGTEPVSYTHLWITELGEKRKELLAQKAAEEATLLPNLLMKYMEIRKEKRKDWTRAGQNRGTSQDLKAVSEALSYLRQKGLSTVEDLEAFQMCIRDRFFWAAASRLP